jgi:Protein of unknown function (DUF3604)/Type I phosphodiesterase / nucleotide pyrophosphatase
VLQIAVDAPRGDLPGRYLQLFGDGGLRYLMDQGIYHTDAHYQHANTETIVGHVSLATGTGPAARGMVGNVWFDRTVNRLVYNIEDPDDHLLTAGGDVDRATEIDPTQRAFYHVRVLEIPTPTWLADDTAFYGDRIELPDDAVMVQQERAYTSPIWYTPSKD